VPEAFENTFYLLAPPALLYPLLGLATLATVVASQALISGAFSLTHQCVQLRYCPRVSIVHTSRAQAGQIYIPAVNAADGRLPAAGPRIPILHGLGIAITVTIAITTLLFAVLTRRLWRWSLWRNAALAGVFLVVDLAFATVNLAKIRRACRARPSSRRRASTARRWSCSTTSGTTRRSRRR